MSIQAICLCSHPIQACIHNHRGLHSIISKVGEIYTKAVEISPKDQILLGVAYANLRFLFPCIVLSELVLTSILLLFSFSLQIIHLPMYGK